jgi:glycosyltransferase involved in cell wall biosynthesis
MNGGGYPRLVSVVMPTYNRAWSLRKSVGSVLAQSYRPIECIVVDDGSTDETPEVMDELAADAPEGIELRYLRQPNGGANSARNRGLIESQGEFICFLDSDDHLVPDSIQIRADVLLAEKDVDLCYGLCSVQDEKGNELRTMNSPWPGPGNARIAAYLFDTNSPLIRRCICALAGLWREDDTHSQEYEYFSRIKFFSREGVFVDKVLSIYVRHGGGNIFDLADREFLFSIFRVVLLIKGLVLFSPRDCREERVELAGELQKVAKEFYDAGDVSTALAAMRESLLLSWRLRRFLQAAALVVVGFLGAWRRIRLPMLRGSHGKS